MIPCERYRERRRYNTGALEFFHALLYVKRRNIRRMIYEGNPVIAYRPNSRSVPSAIVKHAIERYTGVSERALSWRATIAGYGHVRRE